MEVQERNILISAPSQDLRTQIANDVAGFRSNSDDITYSGKELEKLTDNDPEKIANADVILIDEISSFTYEDLKRLYNKIQKINSNVVIIAAGDSGQMKDLKDQTVKIGVERMFERTSPLTEIYRHGSKDVNDIQSSLRRVILGQADVEVAFPDAVYNESRTSGVEYMNLTLDEMRQKFLEDLNSTDDFKRKNTIFVVFDEKQREETIRELRNAGVPTDVELESVVKASVLGEFTVQGLERNRVYVAVPAATDERDMDSYYRALLTGATRVSYESKENAGYLAIMADGKSVQGDPIMVEMSEPSAQAIEESNQKMNDFGKFGDESINNLSDVTKENFDSTKKQAQASSERIVFDNDGLDTHPGHRYATESGGLVSVTERLDEMADKEPDIPGEYAARGTLAHKIVELFIKFNQKKGGKMFTKKDSEEISDLISKYNSEVEGNAKGSRLGTIPPLVELGDQDTRNHPFVKGILNVLENTFPVSENGKYAMPELRIASVNAGIAGTVDIVEVVGYKGGVPIVKVHDLKILTEKGYDE